MSKKTVHHIIVISDYVAMCCGTCQHNKQKDEECAVECDLDMNPRDKYSVCTGGYAKSEEYK